MAWAAALILALALDTLGAPVPALLAGVVVFAAAARRDGARPSERTGRVGRVLVGAAVGASIGVGVLSSLRGVIAWATLASVVVVGVGLAAGLLAARVSGLDVASSVAASAPGGMQELVATSHEHDLRSDVIIGIHLLRRMTVVAAVVAILATT